MKGSYKTSHHLSIGWVFRQLTNTKTNKKFTLTWWQKTKRRKTKSKKTLTKILLSYFCLVGQFRFYGPLCLSLCTFGDHFNSFELFVDILKVFFLSLFLSFSLSLCLCLSFFLSFPLPVQAKISICVDLITKCQTGHIQIFVQHF